MVLEGVVELDDEGVPVDALEDGPLRLGLLDQLLVHRQRRLAELLLRIETPCRGLLDQQHGPVGAFAKTADGLEVGGGHFAGCLVADEAAFDGTVHWFMPDVRADEVVFERDLVARHLVGVSIAHSLRCHTRATGCL